MKAKIALLSSILVALFAVSFLPAAFAAAPGGSISCLTPSSCAADGQVNLTGPGSSATATFLLKTTASSGSTFHYYVCVTGAASCGATSGTSNGWSWSFSPASGVTGTGAACAGATSCEGAGVGTPGTLSLSLTAPTTVTSSNSQLSLTLYACSTSGTSVNCNSVFTEIASLTVIASVPQFGLGMGLALAIGFLGLFLYVRKGKFALPTVNTL